MIDLITSKLINLRYRIEESLFFSAKNCEFWHSTLLDNNNLPVSAGFGPSISDARKIAIAEYLERSFYHECANTNVKKNIEWGIDIIPTACGFAAGFNLANTIHRSIAEATERWVMSKWIDDGFYLQQRNISSLENELDEASVFLISQFDKVLFFEKEVLVSLNELNFKIKVVQTMGLKDGGIFPGSSAQIGKNIWQHAMLESYRHLLLYKNNSFVDRFPENKIRYFAKNAQVAFAAIDNAKKLEWPNPKIVFHKNTSIDKDNYFIARTIIEGWKSWHLGPLERFLY